MASKLMPEDLQIIEGLSNNGAVYTGADYAQGFEVQNDGEINRAPGESPKTNGGRNILRTMDSYDEPEYSHNLPEASKQVDWYSWKDKAMRYLADRHPTAPDIIFQDIEKEAEAMKRGQGSGQDPDDFVESAMNWTVGNKDADPFEDTPEFGRDDLDEGTEWGDWVHECIAFAESLGVPADSQVIDTIHQYASDEPQYRTRGGHEGQGLPNPEEFVREIIADLDHVPDSFGRDDLDEVVDEFEVEDILDMMKDISPEERQDVIDSALQIGDIDPDQTSEDFVKQYLAFIRGGGQSTDQTNYKLGDEFGREDEARQTMGGQMIPDDVVQDPEEFKRRAIEFTLKEFPEYAEDALPWIDHKRAMADGSSPEIYMAAVAYTIAGRKHAEMRDSPWMREQMSFGGYKDAEGFENQVASGITSGGTQVTDEAADAPTGLRWEKDKWGKDAWTAHASFKHRSGWFNIYDNTKKKWNRYPAPVQWTFNHDDFNDSDKDFDGQTTSVEDAMAQCEQHYQKMRTEKDPDPDFREDDVEEAVTPDEVKKSSETWHEQIPGGLAHGKEPGQYDMTKLAQGVEVELEHTSDMHIAIEIAMDHLEENPNYYDMLKKAEKGMSEAVDQGEDIMIIWDGKQDWSQLIQLLPKSPAGNNLKIHLGQLRGTFGGLILDQAEAIVLGDTLFKWLTKAGDQGRSPIVNAAEDVLAQIEAELPVGPLKGEGKEVDAMKQAVSHLPDKRDPRGMKAVAQRMDKIAKKPTPKIPVRESAWDALNEIVVDPHKYYLVQSANKTPDGPVFAAVIDVSPSTGRPGSSSPDWDRYSDLESFLARLDLGDENHQLGIDAEMLWKQLDHKELGMVIDPTDKKQPVNSTTRWEQKGKRRAAEPS